MLLGLLAGASNATEVALVGTLGSRALVSIDGAPPRNMGAGQKHGSVKLLSVTGSQAEFEIDGKRHTVRMGDRAVSIAGGRREEARLVADGRGHFITHGQINGRSIRFLVDTGASNIALGISDARRLGINLENATQGLTQTANGVIVVRHVRLDSVKVGGITLYNVEAAVTDGHMPESLLGMSFLNRTQMVRDGDMLVLTKRY